MFDGLEVRKRSGVFYKDNCGPYLKDNKIINSLTSSWLGVGYGKTVWSFYKSCKLCIVLVVPTDEVENIGCINREYVNSIILS